MTVILNNLLLFIVSVIQLVQFAILFVNGIVLLKIDCGLPKVLLYAGIAQDIYFIYAFSAFYVKTYQKERVKGA